MSAEQTDLNLARLYSETMGRLDSYRRSVQEGRQIEEASNFARWLQFSGMVPLFKAHPQGGYFKVDGWLLASKCELLIEMCNERFRTGDNSPKFEAVEFQSLHHKVDLIAGYLSKLLKASDGPQDGLQGPPLVVLDGGEGDKRSFCPGGARQRVAGAEGR